MHFWLHHTAQYAEKIGSALAERVGQGEVGGVTGRVLCTRWLLGLAFKRPWLAPGSRATPRPDWLDRLRKHYSHLAEGCFLAKRLLGRWASVWQLIVLTITCLLMSGCGQNHTMVIRAEVDMGAVWSQSLDRNGDKVRWRHVWAKSSLKWNKFRV